MAKKNKKAKRAKHNQKMGIKLGKLKPLVHAFEYTHESKRFKGFFSAEPDIMKWLNKLGKQGWEMVHYSTIGTPNGSLVSGIFKRVKA